VAAQTCPHYSETVHACQQDIVTPNNDTAVLWAWLDLRAEPMVVSVPAVPKGPLLLMQWIDLFTQEFRLYRCAIGPASAQANYISPARNGRAEVPPVSKKVLKGLEPISWER